MSIISSHQFTGGWVAANRIMQKHNANKEVPSERIDGLAVLSLARSKPKSDLANYIKKVADSGLRGWDENFPNSVKVINQQQLVSMFKSDKVGKLAFDTLQTVNSLGNEPNKKNADSHELVVDKIKLTLHSIENIHADRTIKQTLQNDFRADIYAVVKDKGVTNDLFNAAESILKSEKKSKIENQNKKHAAHDNSTSFDL